MRHTVEIAEEVWSLDVGGLDTMVAQFGEEAAVAAIDGIGHTSEVAEVVIGGTSVDMVDGHTGRDFLVTPSHIDGMGSKDLFTRTESSSELQIFGFAVRIGFSILNPRSIRHFFPSGGIDTHASHTTVSEVDIERDTCFGARSDIAHLHIVEEER